MRVGARMVVYLELALMEMVFPGMVLRVPPATDLMVESASQ